MNLYDIAIARKLSGGGGGGGSSDFSTAEVTVSLTNGASWCEFHGAFVNDYGIATYIECEESGVITPILYKGTTSEIEGALQEGRTIMVTGNIENIGIEAPILIITGDGTITIS